MPNYVSPGVYTIEKDISDYTPSINTSIVGVLGFASKGPTNVATLITDQNSLISTFGAPSESITGQGLEGALEILEQTNSLYYLRAANTTAADASATLSVGVCPAVMVSGPASDYTTGMGVDLTYTLRIQVWDGAGLPQYVDNDGEGKDFVIPAGTSTLSQAEALRSVIGGGLDSDLIGVETGSTPSTGLGLSGLIYGSFAGSGAAISVSACTGATWAPGTAGVSALLPINPAHSASSTYGVSSNWDEPYDLASGCKAFGATMLSTGTDSVSYITESLYPGDGYNGGVKSDGTTSGNSITVTNLGGPNFSLAVNQDGVASETFKTSFITGSFIEDTINTGVTNLTSDTIKGNLIRENADATQVELTDFLGKASTLFSDIGFSLTFRFLPTSTNPTGQGAPDTYTEETTDGTTSFDSRLLKLVATAGTSLAGGDNGVATTEAGRSTDLIGDATTEPKTGMQAFDDDVLNIGLALVPGIHTQAVQNALITLAETTQGFLALVAPPYAIGTTQDAIDWSNGRSSSTAGVRTAAINSSYAAVHWPWVKIFSTFDSKDRWYDPSIFAARQMAYTDAVSDSWFAPAGFRRGRLTKPTEVEVKLNQGDRDSLYSGGNVVNPIVNFPQQGITIFGQRTTQRSPTSLDRINVRRLMIYIRKVIVSSAQRFVFEPNDEFTWAQIEGVVNPFLDDIRRRRGITEFRVICDSTVNTPVRVDRNELWCKVLVKPTKTAEIIIFEINLTNQSADLGTL